MPCNCARPAEAYPENKEWGPLLWTVLHGLAEHTGKASAIYKFEEIQAWLTLLKELQTIIPCNECRAHYIIYYKDNPLTKNNVIENVRDWLFVLHNKINERLGYAIFLKENLSEKYPSSSIKPNLVGLKIKMDLVVELGGVKLNNWSLWYNKAMHLRSYYGV